MERANGEAVRAQNISQIRDAISWASAKGRSLSVKGAGSKSAIGAPIQSDLKLDLSDLRGVIAYEPSELVLTAKAGTPLREIETLLAAKGQHLAFEPPDYGILAGSSPGLATIGGVLAANLSGPRRLKDGAARDHFLGFEAVSGQGEIFKAGGKVVKNVTGYDLPKLLAGSWGTLGVLTEVTLKVLPKPQSSVTLAITGLSDQEAARLMTKALGTAAEVSAAAHLPGNLEVSEEIGLAKGEAATVLRLEGFLPSVEARLKILAKLVADDYALRRLDDGRSKTLWRSIADVTFFASRKGALWRLSVAPTSGWKVVETIRATLKADVLYDWSGGLIWLCLDTDDPQDAVIRASVRSAGGQATLMRASARHRSTVPTFQPQPDALTRLAQRVKTSFDPNGILNRGRFNLGSV